MSQAIANPEELRAFAQKLKQFNTGLTDQAGLLANHLEALRASWRDQENAKFVEQFSFIHRFVFNKWYFDELYDLLFVKPAFWFGRIFWQKGDKGLIDRFGPDGAAALVVQGAALAKKVQSGYLYSYALIMLLGLIAAITWVLM